MDDQQENVIDGTSRARQWRRATSTTRSATDDAAARSDAPKSIAGSLLVPAEMLPPAFPPDENSNASGRVSGKIRYGKMLVQEGGEMSGDIGALAATDGG